MTVHASKGLEFPIVFVVNMAKGASGPPKADPRHRPTATRRRRYRSGRSCRSMDEADRDREKARDQAAALRRVHPCPRSPLSRLCVEGGRAGARVAAAWRRCCPTRCRSCSARGAVLVARLAAWRVERAVRPAPSNSALCRPPAAAMLCRRLYRLHAGSATRVARRRDVAPQPVRTSVSRSGWMGEWTRPAGPRRRAGDVIVGRLVHRLFQFECGPAGEEADHDRLTGRARSRC